MNACWMRSLAALAGVLCLASPADAELVLGVHPFKPATRLVESFTPLARYLSARLGEPVRLHVARDYQTHLDGVAIGRYDLAYLGPKLYVQLRSLHGPRPLLARQQIGNSPVFHGKIFVRADSPIRRLADLAGKRFAFGDPHSTMGHLVPRYLLWQAGVGVEQLASHKFVGDHLNVALGVLA
ncbi:MAG: phosphate/phosphite/phosphonate ABC transporter substrate-binding protein, partial [Pseudomonadota bacterium]